MARPGELDFAKLAKEAAKTLVNEPVAKVAESKVKVAASEGGIPAPEHAQFDDTTFDEPVEQAEETVVDEVVQEAQEESVSDSVVTKTVKTQEEKAQEVFDIPDTAKVKIKVDGEEQIVSYGEYKDLLRKNATVTQRMQQLAKSRDEINQAVAAKLQEIEQREAALKNASAQRDPVTEALINALTGKTPAKPRDPNEVVSIGDLQSEREALLKQFEEARKKDREDIEKWIAGAASATQEQARANRERQEYINGLNSILNKDEYKVLGEVIPNLTANIWAHVQTLAPQNLEEALEYSRDYVEERRKVFAKHTVAKEQKQQAKAAKQKMESNDGATPTISKATEKRKSFVGKNGKLDWKAMERDAMARVNQMN